MKGVFRENSEGKTLSSKYTKKTHLDDQKAKKEIKSRKTNFARSSPDLKVAEGRQDGKLKTFPPHTLLDESMNKGTPIYPDPKGIQDEQTVTQRAATPGKVPYKGKKESMVIIHTWSTEYLKKIKSIKKKK